MDFTLSMYSQLLDAVESAGYRVITVEEFLGDQAQGRVAVIRHDVDRRPRTALKLAEAEKARKIRTTYYFRYLPSVYKKEIVKRISDMGHEIGYHYEVLDKTKGDVEAALALFKKELEEMRRDFDVNTVCMHGNPVKPWKNLNIFKGRLVESFGIIGEAYVSVDFSGVAYFSDTGRRWDRRYSVKDQVPDNLATGKCVTNTEQLITAIREQGFERLYLVVHPNRWLDPGPAWLRELLSQNIKNMGKALLMRRQC